MRCRIVAASLALVAVGCAPSPLDSSPALESVGSALTTALDGTWEVTLLYDGDACEAAPGTLPQVVQAIGDAGRVELHFPSFVVVLAERPGEPDLLDARGRYDAGGGTAALEGVVRVAGPDALRGTADWMWLTEGGSLGCLGEVRIEGHRSAGVAKPLAGQSPAPLATCDALVQCYRGCWAGGGCECAAPEPEPASAAAYELLQCAADCRQGDEACLLQACPGQLEACGYAPPAAGHASLKLGEPLACPAVVTCIAECPAGDDSCFPTCKKAGRPEAVELAMSVFTCYFASCVEHTLDCLLAACESEVDACRADDAP